MSSAPMAPSKLASFSLSVGSELFGLGMAEVWRVWKEAFLNRILGRRVGGPRYMNISQARSVS
jgi:hypothetical protein